MNVTLYGPDFLTYVDIKNVESFHLSDSKSVSVADLINRDACVIFLEHGNDLENLGTHQNRTRARIRAQNIVASACGAEGGVDRESRRAG